MADVSVVCTVMSVDEDCSPEIAAMIGASIAISISDIPWDGPISGVFGTYNNPYFYQQQMTSQQVQNQQTQMVQNLLLCLKPTT